MASKPSMPVRKPKLKAPAQTYAAQTLEEVEEAIDQIGNLQREHTRIDVELNDAIAELTLFAAEKLQPIKDELKRLHQGVQTWCEAHRKELCPKGSKSANLITGEVAWRQRPPSVRVTGVDAVLAWLKAQEMLEFVRTKEEVNKEAMLNEPEKAQKVPGVAIISGVEDFTITPFEVETT